MFAQGIFRQDPSASPDSLQRRREMLAAMMPRYGSAKYVGEGLGQLFTGIARGAAYRGLDREENKERDRITDAFGRLFSGGGTAVDGAPILGPTPYTPPDPNSPEGVASDAMVALGKQPPAPEGWDAIKSGIFAGESGGDYNALFGYSNRPGGKFAGTNLTDMTVDQALTFADANGPYAQHVKGQVGRVATPMGAYQVVGTTLAAAKKGLGLTGNERMTPELQDRIGQWIYRTQGADAWAGYKGPQTGGPERVVSAGGMDIGTLAEIASSPYADPGQKAVAQALLQQQMQAADPKSALELENMRLQNEALKNPPKKDNRTSDMLEYDRAVLDYIQRGQPVPTFTEWTRGNKASGAASQTVNVNGETGPRIGAIPQGYQLTQDPVSGAYRMEAIPGGPEDTSKKEAAAESNAVTASEVVTTAAARAREAARNRDFGSAGTSLIAGLPIIGARTDSGEVMRQVEVLKSTAKVENLTAMRAASPTGGALGSVTEKEADMLAAKSGALDPNSPNFERDLDDYERTLLRVIHGKEAGDRIFEQTRGGGGQPATGGSPRLRFNPETGDLEPVQ